MPVQSLGQFLILLTASVLLVTAGRRIGLPPLLGYLIVGILLGPYAFAVLPNGAQTQRVGHLAMSGKPSVDFSGYWQRHKAI